MERYGETQGIRHVHTYMDGFSLWTLILNKDYYDFGCSSVELCSPSAFLMLDNPVKDTTLIPSCLSAHYKV